MKERAILPSTELAFLAAALHCEVLYKDSHILLKPHILQDYSRRSVSSHSVLMLHIIPSKVNHFTLVLVEGHLPVIGPVRQVVQNCLQGFTVLISVCYVSDFCVIRELR